MTNLPKAVFPLVVAEIRMNNTNIETIEKGAFDSLLIINLVISNATINRIEELGFSRTTFIDNLELSDVKIKSASSRMPMI